MLPSPDALKGKSSFHSTNSQGPSPQRAKPVRDSNDPFWKMKDLEVSLRTLHKGDRQGEAGDDEVTVLRCRCKWHDGRWKKGTSP